MFNQAVKYALGKLGLELRRISGARWDALVSQDLRQLMRFEGVRAAFDVGAFDGGVTQLFLDWFPQADVHAFEPLDASYRKLCDRFSGISRVKPVRRAVSDTAGTAKFYATQSEQSNSLLKPLATGRDVDRSHALREELAVDTTTIDRYCGDNAIERIELLKLDIQGGELVALKGAEGLLSEGRIDIVLSEVEFVELYKGQPLFCDVAHFLARYGYRLYSLPKLVPDELGQLCWGDAIFCRGIILEDARSRLGQA